MKRIAWIVILLLIMGLGLHACLAADIIAAGAVCSYILLMILPGAFLYHLIETHPRKLECLLAGLVASPIMVGLAGALAMVLGSSATMATTSTALASIALGAVCLTRQKDWEQKSEYSSRHMLALGGSIIVLCMLVGYLPLSDEWWRMRSDGWFHGAVIAEIADFGVPPQDPYFYGMDLQYMWIYHVLVLLISHAVHIDPFYVMPLANMQALAGFCLATFLLSIQLRKRFSFGFSSMLTAVLGMNALFWIFLPVKIVPAFVGETRGWSELARILSLTPLNIETVREFTRFAHSQVFFLDKFIVATAFSLGLSFMAACWYAIADGLTRKRPFVYIFLFLASAGMIAFHTIVGIVMTAGFTGGLFLLLLGTWRRDRNTSKTCIVMIMILLAGAVVLSPFLYQVIQSKESEHLIPISFTFGKIASFIVSCALVIILVAFQAGRFRRERSAASRFFIFAALSTVAVCLLISLPVVNMYDKLPFFVFFPLAVVGGWTLAELSQSRYNFFKNKTNQVIVFIVLFVPLTALHMIGNFATPDRQIINSWEKNAAVWVQENTSRDALFFDCSDRVFLLVSGPRRYYWGLKKYARLWGYDSDEMLRRENVRKNLFDSNGLHHTTLSVLGNAEFDAYLITREENGCAEGIEKLARYPELFVQVHTAGPIRIFEVNRENCKHAATKKSP
jgi:hypothetical protein